MKSKRKLTLLLSGLLVVATVLSSCGGGGIKTQTAESTQSSKTQITSSQNNRVADGIEFDKQGHFVKYNPTITLTTNAIVGSDAMFQDGCDVENNGWTKWMKEKLGIEWKMKWVSPDATANSQKMDLAFASGDLPDVLSGASVDQITKYAKAGKLTALDDFLTDAPALVDYYIKDCENLSKGTYWKPFMVDGKKYAMAAGTDILSFWTVNFIRTDILKELNMDIPSKISDVDQVFAAYHAKYPNGHTLALDKDLNGIEAVTSAYEAYPSEAFGSYSSKWVEKEGELAYGSIQPEMKEALAKLAEWYKKGYIDPEFVVKDEAKKKEDVIAGNVLLYNGPWHSIGSPFTPLWNALPNVTVKAIPFFTGDDGRCGVMKNTWWTDSRAITTSCKNPKALFYLLNDNLDSYYRNEQSLRDALKTEYSYEFKYPITKVQDPTNADEIAKKYPNISQPRQLYLYNYTEDEEGCGFINDYYTQQGSWLGFFCKIPTIGTNDFKTMAVAAKTGDESGLTYDGKRMYDEWNSTQPNMLKTFIGIYDYWDGLMQGQGNVLKTNAFAGAATPAMTEKQTYLNKLQLEAFTQIIMGTKSIDSFDEFVSNWKSNGGDDITKEVNEWYQSNK